MTTTSEATYSTIEAARMAGVSVRQLTHWADRGYLRPIRTGTGASSGSRLRWDSRDVDAAARFGALSAALTGTHLLRVFSQALACTHEADVVGVLLDRGAFTVSVEVRDAR